MALAVVPKADSDYTAIVILRVEARLVALLGALVGFTTGAAGCHWLEEKERAPLNGGETIGYSLHIDSVAAIGTITFEREGRGFLIRASSPAFPPQRVAADLTSPLGPVRAYNLDMLWLPPSQRALGAETKVGTVRREQTYMGRDLYFVERDKPERRTYGFDKYSGFLVYMKKTRHSAMMTGTTIPGM